jgi:Ca2+-binding RTX toxin-like protein
LAQLWAKSNPGSVVAPINLASAIENSVGAFLGAKLGALIYSPQTEAGEALSAIGSAAGAFEGTAVGAEILGIEQFASGATTLGDQLFANVLLPGIGALVGFVLGALIGDLFGSKPKIPTASADTILAIPAATYVVGNETSANGGDLGIAVEMADTARDTLNGIIAQITSNDPDAIVQNTSSPTQDYGYDANGLYVKLNGTKTYVSTADQAVNMGVMWALPQTQIIGGDIFLKRAIANGSTTDLTTLMGDLQIASDYEFYTENRALINSEITAAYATLSSSQMAFYDNNKALVDQVDMSGVSSLTSSQLSTYNANQSTIAAIVQALQAQSVANPWIVTLESASELKLDQWTPSDFYGGMYGLLSSFGLGNMSSGPHYENISFSWNGSAVVASVGGSTVSETTTSPTSYAAEIYLMYRGLFGTTPDPGGWNTWVTQLEQGVSITGVAQDILNVSNEGASLSNAAFVQYLYQTALDRADPDGGGWVSALDTGALTRAQVVVGIVESQEAQNDNAAAISAGLTYQDNPGLNQFSSLTSSSIDGRSFTIDQADWQALGFTLGPTYSGAGAFVDYAATTSPLYIGPEPGNNIIIGGSGINYITAGSGYDWIQGGAAADTLTGGSGSDVIIAGSGNPSIYAGTGSSYIAAGQGYDTIVLSSGPATVVAGNGPSAYTLIDGGSGSVTLIASQSDVWAQICTASGPETISYERFTQGVVANLMSQPAWLISDWNDPNAAEMVQWDPSNPQGYDSQVLAYDATGLIGSQYNDTLESGPHGGTLEGLGGADVLIGGGGITTASYQHSTSGVYVDLATDTGYGGDAQGDTFTNIQNLLGSSYDDELEGLPGSVLNGGPGDDTLDYSGGDNSYIGGGGFDTVDYSTAPSAVYVGLSNGMGAWAAAGDTYNGISEVIGSPYNDIIVGSSTGSTFNGGGGADTFYGSGNDTYILDQGQGTEAIYDTNSGTNTLQLGPGITWDSIYFAAAGGSGGYLTVGLQGTSSAATIYNNFGPYPVSNNDILKTLDLDGASQLDISRIGYAPGVVSGALKGLDNQYNLLDANGQLVPIYASGSAGAISTDGSVIIAGPGGHTIYASGAGDQFAMEYGDGQDFVYGAHQQNTIAFGSTVAASDVIYSVDAAGNLFIGLQSQSNPTLTAAQVPDSIEFAGGGIETENLNTGGDTFAASYLVEAGGTTVNLSQLNIPWLVVQTYGKGGGGNLDPVVFDLNGAGLELSSVASSGVGTVDPNGVVTQLGWVGPDDGILVTDRAGDGVLNTTQDLSFVQDAPGATNDLQGLASWDTNGDGVLNASDTDWNQLKIWVDKNQDGVAEPGEVETMAQAGIASISLKGQASGVDPSTTTESYLVATTSFTTSDGITGAAYDVSLANALVGANGPGPSPYETWSQAASNATIGAIQTGAAAEATPSTASTFLSSASSQSAAISATDASLPSVSSASQGAQTVSVGGISIDTSGAASAQTPGAALWAGASTAAALGGDWSLAAPTGPPSAAALAEQALSGNGVAASTVRDLEPIVLDLTGGGLSLIDPTASNVAGNFSHTGTAETVGWVNGADSFLAYAPGGAATIDPTSDLTFRNDLPGAENSIQGLKAFDTNGDGLINAQDSSYANFYIWNDANGTGVVDPSQTETLAQAGIESISLTPTSLDRDDGDLSANQVIGQIQITMADGTTRTGYDVGLGVEGAASTQGSGATSTPAPAAPSPPAVPTAALTDIASPTTAAPTNSTASSSQTAAATPSASPAVSMAVSQARSAEDGPESVQGAAVAPEVNTDPVVGWWSAASSQPASILNAATLASFGSAPQASTGPASSGAAFSDAATMQRQLLLAQSITAFQGGGTAGSPIWSRGTSASDLSALANLTAARLPTPSAAVPMAA